MLLSALPAQHLSRLHHRLQHLSVLTVTVRWRRSSTALWYETLMERRAMPGKLPFSVDLQEKNSAEARLVKMGFLECYRRVYREKILLVMV